MGDNLGGTPATLPKGRRPQEAVTLNVAGEPRTLTRDMVLKAMYRADPDYTAAAVIQGRGQQAWLVTVRRRDFLVRQVMRRSLGVTRFTTNQGVQALRDLGFRVHKGEPPTPPPPPTP